MCTHMNSNDMFIYSASEMNNILNRVHNLDSKLGV